MRLFKTTPTLRAIALSGLLGAASWGAMAQAEKPQYGGTLNIGMVYVTLSPLTWDPADWAWKFGQDTGLMYEQLFAADLNAVLGGTVVVGVVYIGLNMLSDVVYTLVDPRARGQS